MRPRRLGFLDRASRSARDPQGHIHQGMRAGEATRAGKPVGVPTGSKVALTARTSGCRGGTVAVKVHARDLAAFQLGQRGDAIPDALRVGAGKVCAGFGQEMSPARSRRTATATATTANSRATRTTGFPGEADQERQATVTSGGVHRCFLRAGRSGSAEARRAFPTGERAGGRSSREAGGSPVPPSDSRDSRSRP